MLLNRRITAGIFFVITSIGAAAQAPLIAPTPAARSGIALANVPPFDLDADVSRAMQTFGVPGMAIAIVKDGRVIAARGFGVRKLGEKAAVDGQTIFEIASNSKGFTAATLATLVDEGKLAWDDPVIQHLPDFQMYDAYVTREMTIRDLLVHRSGLGLGAGDLLIWPSTTLTSRQVVQRLRYIKPATSFRSAYAYDNLLYIVAGQVIAQKTGKSWGDAVRERLLAPLGMNMTTVTQAENAGNPNVASAHSKIDGQVGVVRTMPITAAAGAVGVNSNAEDLARWMTALMDGGRVAGVPNGGKDKELRIFSAAQGREMWSAQTPMKIADPKPALAALKPEFQAYGLGFNLRDYKGHKMVLHSGTVQGFKSRVIMIPDARLGVAILTNAESGGAITALEYRVLDQYLNVPPSDWIALVHGVDLQEEADDLAKQQKAGAARASGSKPSLPLSAYDGQYRDAWYGTVSIILEGDKRVMRFSNSPELTGQLEHFQHDTFIVRWNERNFNADAYVSFSLNADGSIERMKMAPVSSLTDFSFDFADLLFVPVPSARK